MHTATERLASPQATPSVPPWRDLWLYLGVGGGGFIVASLLARQFITQVTLTVSLLAYALNIVFFAGSVYMLGVRRGRLSFRAMGFVPPRLGRFWFLTALVLSLALLPLRGLVGVVVQQLWGGTMEGLQMRMEVIAPEGFTWLGFFITLVGAGILVPISEELFFRGAIFTWFRRRFGFGAALWASALLFALGHMDTAGVVASSLVLGLANGFVYERSQTLWAPIIMHITTNSFAVLVVYGALAFAPQLLQT